MIGHSTGYRALDEILGGGLGSGTLCVIAGPSGSGKSALAQNIAWNVCDEARPTIVFSLELTSRELTDRFMSAAASIDLSKLRSANLSGDDYARLAAMSEIGNRNLVVRASGRVGIEEVEEVVSTVHDEAGALDLVVIDSFQRLAFRRPEDDRADEFAAAARRLKLLARRFEASVLVVSQLSHDVARRPDRLPSLSDLGDARILEEFADVIFLIYQDSYYDTAPEREGVVEILLAKHRSGPTGAVKLSFLKRYAKFADLAA